MNTCSWIMDNDEPCGERVEGTTCYCASHGRQLRKEIQEEKKLAEKRATQIERQKQKNQEPRKMPNKVSDKRKEINAEYSKLAHDFKQRNPECAIRANDFCTHKTEDVHHKRGRGEFILDTSTWIPACRSCHDYAHDHPKEAKEKGWSESRLATIKETI